MSILCLDDFFVKVWFLNFRHAKKLSDGVGWRTPVRTPPDNFFAPARSARGRTEQRLVLTRTHRSDRLTTVAAEVAHVVVARSEVE